MDTLHTLWQQRYGADQTPPAGLAGHDWLTQPMAHPSVRAYLDRPLPDATLPALLAAAQSAASSSNLQAFSVVAVQDLTRKARLAECAGGQAHIRQRLDRDRGPARGRAGQPVGP